MSPAAERNKQPILEALRPWLPQEGLVLEVASGAGQHVAHFARALPHLTFLPTDVSSEHLTSIAETSRDLPNVQAPILLNAVGPWPVDHVDFVFNANMIHISPFAAARGLFEGAARVLAPGGRLATYGPYFEDEVGTAPSNVAFDESLRERNPEWGIRRREEVERLAADSGFGLEARVEMPANNLLLVWVRSPRRERKLR